MVSSSDSTDTTPTRESSSGGGFREYGTSILVAVGLALLIRSTIVQAFYIPSGSMEDTLFVGDYLLANKFVFGAPIEIPLVDAPLMRLPAFRDPRQGDIVIFRSLEEAGRDLIKRCVAVGGQTVEVRDKVLYVDGQVLPDAPDGKFVDRVIYPAGSRVRDNFGPLTVPEGHFFMMGDNRDRSRDSRYFGPVPREKIKGKAMIIYWSSTLVSGPIYRLPQMLADAGNFAWNLPSLPFRTRYDRLGTIIH
ncbi:MAG: signal peptidase I [Gemmatimonadetes bacterium]|jgi:signal peptidase I|nr:signal peptidase I [Gemmatimonadota bacterium]MBT7864383.1 signal peptidase I [Gemmatimonadota bacterium]